MGVPKFYRWISERYPCLSEVVKEYQIPEFDTLYLDMNGIIHVCSHPEDDNPHFRITEEKIFTDVSHYIEFLFRMIKPRKSFFMAIDGVAPRAKMNQQRGRRFRSAREAEALEQKAREKGETLPTEKRFDSNCITPGTPFMARLQDYLKYFVVEKISTDPLWQSTQVYLSGHETPGEGEHKVMDYIRYQKAQPDYNPNTRHCLYGLDADLMMLGLASHEPHFCLLREEVRFAGRKDKNKRPATPEETTFHLLHLSLMREYIDFEFSTLKAPGKLSFRYDLDRIIDDWVLMGFLVGNDFIPHLPNLHIHHDGLPLLWRTYMTILPTLDDYLHDSGHLNLPQFEKYLRELSKYDVDTFSEQFSDLKWLEGKSGKKYGPQGAQPAGKRNRPRNKQKPPTRTGSNQFAVLVDLDADDADMAASSPATTKQKVDTDLIDLNSQSESPDTEDDSDTFDTEFIMHKANYYMTKMNYIDVTQDVLCEQATEYVRAIQWILLYYYEGVPSWSWFYPHHYAPYMSDVKDFSNLKIEFDLSRPFLPFQQLMGVLPAASKDFLPVPYQKLMTTEDSPLVDFYPTDFKTDLNGKLQEWEAVVLIPFIEESRLLKALLPIDEQLTDEEKARNRHGPHRLFEFSKEHLGEYASPCPDFPDIAANRARCTEIPMFEFRVPSEKLRKGLPAGVRQDVYFPGFPTLKHIPHKAELKKAGVKVFQMNSRGENMVVTIIQESQQLMEIVAQDRLGKSSFVGWPHLFEAKVVEISDGRTRYNLEETTASKSKGKTTPVKQDIKTEALSENEAAIWRREVGSIKENYYEKRGIDVGDTSFLIRVLPLMGRKYICTSHGQITLEKQWAVRPVPFVHQATVKDITVHDSSYIQFTNLEELFAPKTPVFMLGFPHYGCQGEVVDVDSKMEGRVRVSVTILQEPQLESIKQKTHSLSMHYMPGYIVAQRLGINGHFLSRITGTVFVARGSADTHDENLARKINVGLNLKFNKRNEEVPGYTKKIEGQWQYSSKALDTVSKYLRRFPKMFEFITSRDRANNADVYFESDIFNENGSESLKDVEEFLKTQPCTEVKPMKIGAEILDELLIKEIEKEVDRVKLINKKKRKSVKMQVKPHLLFRPIFLQGGLIPDPGMDVQLFDRVVNMREGYSVPFGLRGTVIGIHTGATEADTMYEIVFDSEFLGGINLRCSPGRGYRCASNSVINLSYGERKEAGKHQSSSTTSNTNQWSARSSNTNTQQNRGSNSNFSYAKFADGRSDVEEKDSSPRGQTNQQYGNQNTNNRYNRGFDSDRQSNPQFVTPRLNARPLPVKTNQSPGQRSYGQQAFSGNNEKNSSTNEFADIWKELQVSNVGSPERPPPRSRGPPVDEWVAGDQRQHGSSHPTSKPKTVKDELNRKFVEMGDPQQSHDQDSQPGSRTKIDLQSLFGQASAGSVDKNSEFAAMINSLEISGAPGTSPESQNGSEAIKQMLQIQGEASDRVSPSSPRSPRSPNPVSTAPHNYGKQVSIQELFEGAKQSSASVPPTGPPLVPPPGSYTAPPPGQFAAPPPGKFTVPPPGPPHATPQISSQTPAQLPKSSPIKPHQSQHTGTGYPQPVHPGKSPRQPMNAGKSPRQQHHGNSVPRQPPPGAPPQGLRNPVMELLDVSKSLGLGPPKYDYFTPQKGQIGAYVMLGTGQKFQGSTCWTREEAAESAASMALLQLTKETLSFNMMMPGMKMPPGMQSNPAMWSTAFPYSMHQQPPPQYHYGSSWDMGSQPLGHQGHPGSAQHLHGAPLHGHLPHGPPPRGPPSYGPPTHVPQTQPTQGTSIEQVSQERDSAVSTVNTPFIPLQVTKKQKTPQKAPPSKRRDPQEKGANSLASASVPDETKGNTVSNTGVATSHGQQRLQGSVSLKSSSTGKADDKGDKSSTQTHSDAGGKPKQPKRARSRLAANFNFGPQ